MILITDPNGYAITDRSGVAIAGPTTETADADFVSWTSQENSDLLITDDDLAPDAAGVPKLVSGRDCITQDIKHMIRETGLLVELVGNRNARKEAKNLLAITIEVDNDERIVPGSASIEKSDVGVYNLTATTVAYGEIGLELEA